MRGRGALPIRPARTALARCALPVRFGDAARRATIRPPMQRPQAASSPAVARRLSGAVGDGLGAGDLIEDRSLPGPRRSASSRTPRSGRGRAVLAGPGDAHQASHHADGGGDDAGRHLARRSTAASAGPASPGSLASSPRSLGTAPGRGPANALNMYLERSTDRAHGAHPQPAAAHRAALAGPGARVRPRRSAPSRCRCSPSA